MEGNKQFVPRNAVLRFCMVFYIGSSRPDHGNIAFSNYDSVQGKEHANLEIAYALMDLMGLTVNLT